MVILIDNFIVIFKPIMKFENKQYLVLSGGGSKGWITLGVLQHLKDQGYLKNLKGISATSVGSIIAILYLSNDLQLYEKFMNDDILSSKDIDISLLFDNFGLNNGMVIVNGIDSILEDVYNIKNCTMKQLYELSGIDLNISSSNITKGCLEYFNHINAPDLLVSKAVRMSCSIPFFFTKIEHDDNIYSDGGLMASFAIHPFLHIDPKHILSIDLCSASFKYDKICNIFEYISNILNCLLQANRKQNLEYDNVSIEYDCPLIILNQSYQSRKEMYDYGYHHLQKEAAE